MLKTEGEFPEQKNSASLIPGTMFLTLLASGNDSLHSHLFAAALLSVSSDGSLKQTAWIFDRPYEEQQILLDMREQLKGHTLYLCQSASYLRSYLQEKLTFYGITIPAEAFRIVECSFEKRALISYMKELYHSYFLFLTAGDPEQLDLIQTELTRVLSSLVDGVTSRQIPGYTDGSFQITGLSRTEDFLRYELLLPQEADKEVRSQELHFIQKGCQAVLYVPYFQTELKYFLPDYKQYYYLPASDEAIHKSLGSFIEPRHRRRAKPETCYIRRNSYFLPQPVPVEKPVFRESYESKRYYFECTEEFFSDHARQHVFLCCLLQELFYS